MLAMITMPQNRYTLLRLRLSGGTCSPLGVIRNSQRREHGKHCEKYDGKHMMENACYRDHQDKATTPAGAAVGKNATAKRRSCGGH